VCKHIKSMGKHVKLMNRVAWASMPNPGTIICFYYDYFLFNYMITKINDRKIKYQTNIKTFY
jgi:hypothetical protein